MLDRKTTDAFTATDGYTEFIRKKYILNTENNHINFIKIMDKLRINYDIYMEFI